MIAQRNRMSDVRDYIDGVMSGDIVTGRLARMAVQRHVRDLEHAGERGYYFDKNVAFRSLQFFPSFLNHTIGEWAGQPFELNAWQSFCVWCIFGWRKTQDRFRRFRKAHLSMARKNGKTTLAAGILAKAMYFDEPTEHGAQGFCTATKEEQAKLLYNELRRMIEGSPELLRLSRIRKAPAVIQLPGDAFVRAIGTESKGLHGSNPHIIIKDEVHEWRERHRDAMEAISTGGAARNQQLELIITTAGDDHSQIWIEEDDYARNVLEAAEQGQVFDDSYFAFICRLDEGDDPFEESNWIKANPNYGTSVKPEYMRRQALEAKNKPSAANSFKRFHCNLRTGGHDAAISQEDWAKGNAPTTFKLGDYCHGGLDLGRTNDWAAISLVFPKFGDDGRVSRYELWSKSWTCRDGRFRVDREPFRTWIANGWLECCTGDQIDYSEIRDEIFRLHDTYDVRTWAYDPHYAGPLWQLAMNERPLNPFPFSQSPAKYNAPFRQFVEKDVPGGRIVHGGDPVLRWQAMNVCVSKPNKQGHIMPDKSNMEHKIDGMVAAIMAFSECLYAEKQQWFYASNQMEMG